jgi:Fic family protein
MASVGSKSGRRVSPWFEARRAAYYDRLLAVSTNGDWDGFVGFFAQGLEAAAQLTRRQMIALVAVQGALKDVVRASALRADSAHALIDLAVGEAVLGGAVRMCIRPRVLASSVISLGKGPP